MARKCRCAITGEYGTSDIFIKIGTKYYKSQEVYEKDKYKKELRKELVDYICREFLDYYEGQPFPPILPQKLKELEFYDNEIILETFKRKTKDIHYSITTKKFDNDIARLSYIFAIVKNSIADVQKQIKYTQRQTYKQEISRLGDDVDINNVGSKISGKDISNWLEEDEL